MLEVGFRHYSGVRATAALTELRNGHVHLVPHPRAARQSGLSGRASAARRPLLRLDAPLVRARARCPRLVGPLGRLREGGPRRRLFSRHLVLRLRLVLLLLLIHMCLRLRLLSDVGTELGNCERRLLGRAVDAQVLLFAQDAQLGYPPAGAYPLGPRPTCILRHLLGHPLVPRFILFTQLELVAIELQWQAGGRA